METRLNKPHRKREEMISLIESWKASGISQDIFCKEHHIPYNVFQYWFRKFKHESNKTDSGFVEMKINSGKDFHASLEIVFPSGAKLLISGKPDPAFIRSLVF